MTSCTTGTSNLTLYWPDVDLELRPYSGEVKSDIGQFDWVRAKFSKDVGEYLEPHTKQEDGVLRNSQPAHVRIDGDRRFYFYFQPDYIEYGTENCWIELHDPQKHLKETVVDKKWKHVTLKEAYREVYNLASGGDVFKGIKFGVPEGAEAKRKNLGEDSTVTLTSMAYSDEFIRDNALSENLRQKRRDSVVKLLDGIYNINLDAENCLDAIWELNKKFGLTSWVDPRGRLWIGKPKNDDVTHIAAPDDNRVWNIEDANISHPQEPIKKVVVNGNFVDAPNARTDEEWIEGMTEFLNQKRNTDHDLLPQGVAQRADVETGQSLAFDVPEANRDSLDALALQKLINEVQKQNSGSVDINAPVSGDKHSAVADANVGDYLYVASEEDTKCGETIQRDIYSITGVHHSFSESNWNVSLDVIKYPNSAIGTTVRYFDPVDEDYLTSEEVYG